MARVEFGHTFEEYQAPDTRFPGQTLDGWICTDGNTVIVTTPKIHDLYWRIWVPHLEDNYPLNGERAEEMAFSVAVLYVEQDSGTGSKTSNS